MTTVVDRQARLAEILPPAWRDVFTAVPRHLFMPATVWLDSGSPPVRLRRQDDPEAWMAACYEDRPLITQLDDGADTGRGYFSSSASKPSIVADMLEAAHLASGQQVLEIGTGTGWNAALIGAVVGVENVTTVEVDTRLADAARTATAAAGWPVKVVAADGTKGYPDGAPFDRILSTAAVQQVPGVWVEQTRPGGRIVTPWGTSFHNGTLARLDVAADGLRASGRFGGNAGFMWVRSQRTPHGTLDDRVRPEHGYAVSSTDLHPYDPVGDFDASFAIGLLLPGVKDLLVFDDDIDGNPKFTVYLMDPGSGSWASWRVTPQSRGEYEVRQHGPRLLFDELAAAYRWWEAAGRPEHSRFGLTVTSDRQEVWLDEPTAVVAAPVPTPS
ncbi:methyltransferase domain-containing protein [Streptomonospora sp. PA3]|uniref:methyltransferase domain-containing protein n=1 Tax=Streptomonospora sp. PA3 TaxID=2607326 RepID=UPI0013076508|nr:methyltransferase domain-containing protein [Streptomonospora sp. PA3]